MTWQTVTDDWPPEKVRCVIKTRGGDVYIAHRSGKYWYIQRDNRIPLWNVVMAMVLD